MRAMILTAGLGTRLRPLTLELAKPAAPLCRKPIILRLAQYLEAQGVEKFRLNLHHLPETIEEVFQGTQLDVSFRFEPKILGAAGGLKNNEDFFENKPFLMVNGDIFTTCPLKPLIDFHLRERPLATLGLIEQKPPYAHFPVRINKEFELFDFKGSTIKGVPRSEVFVFTGVHVLDPEIFQYIPKSEPYDINSQVYVNAMKAGERVCGFPIKGYWNDLGDPNRYLRAHMDLLSGVAGPLNEIPIAHDATIDPSARIGPTSVVDNGCVVGASTVIENSVLWPDVKIYGSTKLNNCIVARSVKITGNHSNKIITNNGTSVFEF